jgi:hypothetical protein
VNVDYNEVSPPVILWREEMRTREQNVYRNACKVLLLLEKKHEMGEVFYFHPETTELSPDSICFRKFSSVSGVGYLLVVKQEELDIPDRATIKIRDIADRATDHWAVLEKEFQGPKK